MNSNDQIKVQEIGSCIFSKTKMGLNGNGERISLGTKVLLVGLKRAHCRLSYTNTHLYRWFRAVESPGGLLLQVWSAELQHEHHLGACGKCGGAPCQT